MTFGLEGQATQSWWRGAVHDIEQITGFQTSAVFWKTSLHPAALLRISARLHRICILSWHKSELCWSQGYCTPFLQPQDLAPKFSSSVSCDPDGTLLLPRQYKSAPPFKWKHSQCCDFPSIITRRLNSFIMNKHDCSHWCVSFQRQEREDQGKEQQKRGWKGESKQSIDYPFGTELQQHSRLSEFGVSLGSRKPAQWRKVKSKPRSPASKSATLHSASHKPWALCGGSGARWSDST